MSLSTEPPITLVTDDPRINQSLTPYYVIERSASEVAYRTYPSDSFLGGNILINTQVSSRDTVVASKMYIRYTLEIQIEKTTNNYTTVGDLNKIGYVLGETPFTLRFMPLMSATTNLQVKFNGKPFSEPIDRYYAALMRYNNTPSELARDFSTFPSALDMKQSFNELKDDVTTRVGDYASIDGQITPTAGAETYFIKHPNPYMPSSRGQFVYNMGKSEAYATQAPNVNRGAKITIECTEPIILSPLVFGAGETKGFIGLDTIELNIAYSPSRLLLAVQQAVIPTSDNAKSFSVKSVVLKAADGEFITLVPRANIPLPKVFRWKYNNIVHVPKLLTVNNTASYVYSTGARISNDYQSDNITLVGLPKFVYIFLKRPYDKVTNYTPDTYYFITNVNITMGSKPGILADASPFALHMMSIKNGLIDSYDACYRSVGSVICIDFAQDVGLNLLDAPGALSKMTFQCKIQADTLYSDTTAAAPPALISNNQAELNMVFVYEGMLHIKDGVVNPETSIISPADILNSPEVQAIARHQLVDFYGGSYSGGKLSKYIDLAKKGYQRGKEIYTKAKPYVEKAVKVGKVVAPAVASLLAAGYTENELIELAARLPKKNAKGGKLMNKKALKSRAINYY